LLVVSVQQLEAEEGVRAEVLTIGKNTEKGSLIAPGPLTADD
jgi:hypothetical protein